MSDFNEEYVEPTSVYVRVVLKDNPNIAVVQTGLRNAGFDLRNSDVTADPVWMEGVIAKGQMQNLLGVPYVDSVKAIREVR
jgi:hypothetical protein